MRLAREMIAGFRQRREDFPSPLVPVEELEDLLSAAQDAVQARVLSHAKARQATRAAEQAFKKLTKAMNADLRYAEIQARKNPTLLRYLGWGPRRPRRSPQPPGEVRDLRIVRELQDSIALAWKKPVDGGRPTGYQVQRRRTGARWHDVATVMETETELDGHERGVEYAYRVRAFNKAGEGPHSSTVRAVL